MDKMARKDPSGFQGCKGPLVPQGYLERKVYLDLQVEEDSEVLQVPEVNLGHLLIWKPVPEFQGFLVCLAQEDQKDPGDSLEKEDPPDQGAKESLDWMAEGAEMASLGLPGLLEAKVTLERLATLEYQDLLVPLGTLDPKG